MAGLSIKDNQIYKKLREGQDAAQKAFTEGAKAGLTIAKNQNQSDRVTPAQLKLIQDSRGVQSPYQPKEAIDPLDPAKGVVDKAMLNPNTILLPFDVKDDSKYSVPGGGSQGPQPTDDESEDLLRRLWSHNPMEVDSLADKWGATILPDGETWMIPTKEGTLRPATEEETIMLNEDFLHRQMYDRNQPHPHLADAKALTDTLSPYQNPRTGSLRDIKDWKERKNLLIQGVGAHKA